MSDVDGFCSSGWGEGADRVWHWMGEVCLFICSFVTFLRREGRMNGKKSWQVCCCDAMCAKMGAQ